MAIPPPRLSDLPDKPDADPLEKNAFDYSGYSVQYLGPFKVFDDETNSPCRIAVDLDVSCEVAPQWADNLEEAPMGAVQHTGSVTIRFSPAVSGRVYRIEAMSGSQRKRYIGPDVAANALPKPASPALVATKEFLKGASPVRLAIAGIVLVAVLAGAGMLIHKLLS